MHFTLLAVGSRGDVEPLLALALGLEQAGHRVRLATLAPFESLVRAHGFEFASLGELPRRFTHRDRHARTPAFNGVAGRALFWWLYASMVEARLEAFASACVGTDALVFGGLGFPVCHVAEAMRLPCFWVAPAPHTATDAFADPFFAGRWYVALMGLMGHRLSYAVEEQLRVQSTARIINRWRQQALGLSPLERGQLAAHFTRHLTGVLCNFSEQLVRRPPDWPANAWVTGAWPMPVDPSWEPSLALQSFLDAGPPPVYLGFGSMSDRDPAKFGRLAIDALHRCGQRGLIVGLQARLGRLPEGVAMFDDVPHDWLFPRVSLVVHHAGAGTTAAAIRAGRPSIVIPFAYDQPFWAERLTARGAARVVLPAELTAERLAAEIRTALRDDDLHGAADALRRSSANEDGIASAIAILERRVQTPC